jgi:hypothetical protein
MNRHQKPLRLVVRPHAYRQALQRLDEALAKSSVLSDTERIDLLRLRLFGVLAGSDEPGPVAPPESTAAQ